MAKITVLVCDAPACMTRADVDPGPFVSQGYLIPVVHYDGGRVREVFACTESHIEPAITARIREDREAVL